MPKRGENIYHRKDGRWEGRYKLPNEKKYRSVYAKSCKECRELRNKRIYEARSVPEKKGRFSEICSKWLSFKRQSVKISTYIKYKATVEHYFFDFFKDDKICLTAEKLRSFIEYLTEKGLSPKSISEQFKLLKQIAVYTEIAEPSAFEKAREYLPRQKKNTVKVMSEHERAKLEAYLLKYMDVRSLAIYLAMSLGLRIGEVCALMWSDIDFERRTLSVNKTMQRVSVLDRISPDAPKTQVIVDDAKTKSGMREIPLPDKLMTVLKKFRPENENTYISTGSSKFTEPRTLSAVFHKLLKKLHISDINFHVLRHTFATRYAEKIGNIKALSEILGHATIQITMLFYVHPSAEFKRESIGQLL